jgi:hypothetical protein
MRRAPLPHLLKTACPFLGRVAFRASAALIPPVG